MYKIIGYWITNGKRSHFIECEISTDDLEKVRSEIAQAKQIHKANIHFMYKDNETERLHFGKFKGTKVRDMTTPEQVNYLHWILNNDVKVTQSARLEIYKHLGLPQNEQ